ncbi:hypothetical protein F4779DRAFT_499929 [Xylariaceae sp. FL0662B]|nr:hypothetical protein F4779DRAFT_499929 [Xylariaceae sp. FL0662B]
MGQIFSSNKDLFFARPKRHRSRKKPKVKPKAKKPRKHKMAHSPANGRSPLLQHPPASYVPQGRRDIPCCPCALCQWTRQWQELNARPFQSDAPEVGISGSPPPKSAKAPTNKSSRAKPDSESQKPQFSIPMPVPTYQRPHSGILYPDICVYPNSAVHLSFPVVNYSAAMRAQYDSPRPICYMAIAPSCAEPQDFEAAMAPPGSGLILLTRLLKNKQTARLSEFWTASELRDASLQLEVWDEVPRTAYAQKGSGTRAGSGSGGASEGPIAEGSSKSKGKKKYTPSNHDNRSISDGPVTDDST